jgi:hypothetical protein
MQTKSSNKIQAALSSLYDKFNITHENDRAVVEEVSEAIRILSGLKHSAAALLLSEALIREIKKCHSMPRLEDNQLFGAPAPKLGSYVTYDSIDTVMCMAELGRHVLEQVTDGSTEAAPVTPAIPKNMLN